MIKGQKISLPAPKDGKKLRIACVGDSITEGWRSSNPATKGYPTRLQELIGEDYEITNYGIGGSTVMRNGDMPYREKWGYINSIADRPDLVFLMMGTNDCNREFNIERLGGFYADYVSFINEYHNAGAEVAVMTCPELFCNFHNEHIRKAVEWQKTAAEHFKCPVLDVNEFSHSRHHFFPDDVHCDDSGYFGLACFVANRAFGLDLYELEIKTEPFAKVFAGDERAYADRNGYVKFELPKGEYLIYAILKGSKSEKHTVTLDSDLKTELSLSGGGKDVAYLKPAFASSNEPGNRPENLTDGKEETRWASVAKDGEWITVDLGEAHSLVGVSLTWETAFAQQYEIQLSQDNVNYVTVAANYNGSGGEEELELPEGSEGRYIRVLCLMRGTFYGFSLYDLKVYGSKK